MDEYDKKFAEMQKYIPFLEAMIERLQKVTDSSRVLQLQKMQQLHGILTSKKRKLKLETLQKCEAVLLKLHSKVDKGNSGLNFPVKKSADTATVTNVSTSTVGKKSEESQNQVKDPAKEKQKPEEAPVVTQRKKDIKPKKKMNETPASPSPPASPDPEDSLKNAPIVIPTERAPEYEDNIIDKQKSLSQSDSLSTKKPINIPTESHRRKSDVKSLSRLELSENVNDSTNSLDEWSMLEASEKASKLGLSNKVDLKQQSRHLHNLPTSSASRRFGSPSEKSSDHALSDVAKEVIKSNALKQCRNKSPPDPFRSKKTPASLTSIPLDRSGPLLSKSDLAELLNDDPTHTDKSDSKNIKERLSLENKKVNDKKSSWVLPKNIEKDSDRRWEEVDKHIVKMTPRNNIPPSITKGETSKIEQKSQIHSTNNKTHIDNHDRSSRHSSEFRHNDPNAQIPNLNVIKTALSQISEDDYANLVNIHLHNDNLANTDDRTLMHQRRASSHAPSEMHLHKSGPPSYASPVEDFRRESLDSRHQDHYDIHNNQPPMHQQPGVNPGFCGPQWRGQNPNVRGHPNAPPLSPRSSHYQHSGNLPPQDNWNVGPNPGAVDNFPPHRIQSQYGPNLNRGVRSMIGPNNEMNFADDRSLSSSPQSIPSLLTAPCYPKPKFNSFPHDNRPIEQPFDRSTEFSRGPVRPQWEPPQNRPNDVPFDRANEYSHGPPRQQWSGPPNRPNEPAYDRPHEYPHGPSRQMSWDVQPNRPNEPNFHEVPRGRGAEGPYGRAPNDLPPWNRGNNDPSNRGRGGDRFMAERARINDPSYGGFNRRNDWERPPVPNDNRFGMRDPRYRPEAPQQMNNPNMPNVRRDPRLIKDNIQIPVLSAKPTESSSASRDPRRRNSESKEPNKSLPNNKSKATEQPKDNVKPSVDTKSNNEKTVNDKLKKDIDSMKSPLHSLYGAIDTAAKTGKGYGLQKFKIPKIKKQITPRPPTPPRPSSSHSEDKWDADVPTSEGTVPLENDSNEKLHDEKKVEVTSTTEESVESLKDGDSNDTSRTPQITEVETTSKVAPAKVDEDVKPKKDAKEESETAVDTSMTSKESESKSKSTQDDLAKLSNTATQELIEALFRKSLESREAKALLENARILKKLSEVFNSEKSEKILKIIESDSESSSSDDKGTIKHRKKILKKKKPVIESDSSDGEPLAARLDSVKESLHKSPVKTKKTQIGKVIKNDKSESDSDNKDDIEAKSIINDKKQEDAKEDKEEDELEEDSKTDEVKKLVKTPPKRKRKAKKTPAKKKVKKTEEVINDEVEVSKEDEAVKPPIKKPRKQKRRNSLEMLQEDVREMFISDGVISATGVRMCRLIKEAQGNLPSIDMDDKGNNISGDVNLLEGVSEIHSDEAEFKLKPRPRSRNERSKTPDEVALKTKENRSRKSTGSKLSKEIISSSDDSDDDDNFISRSNDSGRRSKDPLAVTPTLDENYDDGPVLRRSERVAFKEPRVMIEKTELSKIDSSHVFDTSSDESFGIDVTELTAAVDISLHPEKNSSKVSKKKTLKKTQKTTSKNTLETNDKKIRNTPLPFDDDASIASDASVASSNASNIKKSSNPPSTNTNEELIANVIGELANNKDKDSSIEKVTDLDNDEDMDPSHEGTKKAQPLKRKKKRASWQMGVVPKSKRKKICHQTDPSNSSEVLSDDAESRTLSKTAKSKGDSSMVCDDNDLDNGNSTLNESKSKTTSKPPSKNSNEKKQLPGPAEKYKDVEELPYPDLDLNELIEYAWTGQERYKCLLCSFSGKCIAHHYAHHHPKNENMISRLTMLDAKRAIDEAKDEEIMKLSKEVNSGPTRKFTCRFCAHIFEGEKYLTMEQFYEHCTTHTGEYRFTCKCNYRTTIKSSMRAHYYKVCRKNNENFVSAIQEDPIPSDEYIPGYLCSLCNFIQLKESNIKNHIQKIHKNVDSDIEIIKINMSGYLKVKDSNNFINELDGSIKIKFDSDSAEENECQLGKIKKPVKEIEKNSDDSIEDSAKDILAEKSDITQDDGENSMSKKLNAFVCPPELENKEVEIQLERKKKMQEIVDNIGLKIQKDTNEKRLSIIDKLQTKMTTSETQPGTDNANTNEEEYLTLHNGDVTERVMKDVTALSESQLIDTFDEEPRFKSEYIAQTSSSMMHDELSESCTENALMINEESDELNIDKSDKKMKDPLALFHDDAQKDLNSEIEEASDSEAVADVNGPYESDSSDEVSEPEIQTDVSSLLKETINTPTKVPVMNTIQRLAAQLQGAKSFPAANAEETSKDTEEQASGHLMDTSMQLPIITNVVSESVEQESLPQDQSSVIKDTTGDTAPKNFIRLRRLPGDLLSTGDSDSNKQPDPETSSSTESSAAKTSETTVSRTNENILNTSEIVQPADEEGSFLKIENVVSLAPSQGNSNDDSSLINDIRKAVGTSPLKPVAVSLLKKVMGPNILKKLRPMNSVDNLYNLPPNPPASNTVTATRATSSPSNTSKNFKIVKVVRRGTTLLKSKDSGQNPAASSLKNPDTYKSMLTGAKLRHLYKCMARTCAFTTDSCDAFGKHYQNHVDCGSNLKPDVNDFQRCAYCEESLKSPEDMKNHYKTRHSFCSFQCNYCFYRAFTQSYVELHQKTKHPGKPTSVILGMRDYHPAEMIDRREHVLPFICKHECNKLFYVPEAFIAHLKTKHGPSLAIFKCHLCETTAFKAESLIGHYKMHGIYKYQCLYCLSGADNAIELHNHLSNSHSNRPPKILERSLPPAPVRDKDVLLQLIIRNLDDNYKCTELKIVQEAEMTSKQLKTIRPKPPGQQTVPSSIIVTSKTPVLPSNSIIVTPKNQVPPPSNIIVATKNQVQPSSNIIVATKPQVQQSNNVTIVSKTKPPVPILPRPNKSANPRSALKIIDPRDIITLLEKDRDINGQPIQLNANTKEMIIKESNNFSHNGGITVLKIAEKPTTSLKSMLLPRPDKSSTVVDDRLKVNSDAMSTIHPEPELELRYVSDQLKTQIVNAVDPLSIPDDNPSCDDEFINTNFLDNSQILKPTEQSRVVNLDKNDSVQNDDDDNDDDDGNEDDDSDIEILEYIQHPDKTKNSSNDQESSAGVFTSGESEFKPNIEKIVSLNAEDFHNTISEDKLALQDFSGADNSAEKNNLTDTKVYKTLDDIKDTGYAGSDLYKCGYSACDFSAEKPDILKEHISKCPLMNESKELFCVHCQKRFYKIGYLLDHFRFHGLKRFGCALCHQRFPVAQQAINHMKMKHKANHKMLPADPTNPSEDGLYVLHACTNLVKIKKGKVKSNSKSLKIEEKVSFGPADIELLPRQAIYQREVQCAVCPYTTKVRTNIIRHLQLHATEENVPESGPVNPVPCLDKKERMFDKMVNLASSSHQNGRMSTSAPKENVSQNDIESLPKFVPESKRYVCSVSACNYLTVDETMLRHHMKALHPEEQYFRCPHCPSPSPGQESQNIIIDKMGVHLKMHDTKLYKCSHCNHHHYHRHVVERHLLDKHQEKRPFVKVIREIENPESNQSPIPPEEVEDGPCDKDGNYWKCNMCEYKCTYKHEMTGHMTSVHNEKSQFKCGLCVFKTPSKMSLEQHIISKHINDENVDYTLTYERVKGTKKAVESTDPISTDEPFDTTPLWRRDMPRVRHIRGILYEDEPLLSSESSGKASKRKSDAEICSKPAKIKSKSSSLDGSPEKSKFPMVIDELDVDLASDLPEEEITDPDLLEKKFFSYGEPDGNRMTCTVCNKYRSRYRQDMRDHIYRELKYWRHSCGACDFNAVSQSHLTKHMNRHHKNSKPEAITLKSNKEIETWVQTLMNRQQAIIRGSAITSESLLKLNKSPIKPKVDDKVIPPTITLEDSDSSAVPLATINNVAEHSKTVDLTNTISSMLNVNNDIFKTNSIIVNNDNDDDDDEDDDNDDDDDNALVIDSKDEIIVEEEEDEEKEKKDKPLTTNIVGSTVVKTKFDPEKSLACKHCGDTFSRLRGFKTHVQLKHLKRSNFLCPYCDRSANAETIMRQHIRAKHPGCVENIVPNPAANGPELDDDFWEREYGLVKKKKTKKRKIKVLSGNDKFENDKMAPGDICSICGFTAINATGLAAHMRAHANKHTLKCAYCSFTANSKSDVWQHSEINHPLKDWKAEEINTPGSSDQPPLLYTKTRTEQDYSNDIEEEIITEPSKTLRLYNCFYCTLRSGSLDSIKQHWSKIHKDYNETSSFKTGVPFRYTEDSGNNLAVIKIVKCAYCSKKGSVALIRSHSRRKHPDLPFKYAEAVDKSRDIYVCKWCNEVCESNTKLAHHTSSHSHLPMRFRREQEIAAVQKGYGCPLCDFSAISLLRIKRHVSKHYDNYRCKRCDENFPNIGLATQHSTKEHPGLAATIEGTLTDLEALFERITEAYVIGNSSVNNRNDDGFVPSNEVFRNLGVAKKSTTKQLVKPSTGPTVRAVARKSTNPLPRYPPGLVFSIDGLDDQSLTKSEGFSYYGLPREPVDLSNITTMMTVGSFKTKLDCTALAKFVNIDPYVILTDIKTDPKYSSLIQQQTPSQAPAALLPSSSLTASPSLHLQ